MRRAPMGPSEAVGVMSIMPTIEPFEGRDPSRAGQQCHRSFSSRRPSGVTLVELLVGLVVALIVLLALTTLYITTVRASSDALSSVRLNQDLRAAMMVITSDLRRAGYWSVDFARNPFPADVHGGFLIWDAEAAPPAMSGQGSEIRYWYDRDDNFFGLQEEAGGQVSPLEFFGFRFNSGALEMRAAPAGGWIQLVGGDDDPVTITDLTFTAVGGERTPDADGGEPTFQFVESFECRNTRTGLSAGCAPDPANWTVTVGAPGDWIVQKRRVLITMEGTLNGQRAIISEVVKIRNDRRFQM